jgi:hypothetical protein
MGIVLLLFKMFIAWGLYLRYCCGVPITVKAANHYRLRFIQSYILPTKIYIASYTANGGPVRVQYKCLIPTYAYPEMKLLIRDQN